MRNIQSYVEPDGYNYQSQMPDMYRSHGKTIACFSASVTQNSIELHQWQKIEYLVRDTSSTIASTTN